MKNNSFKHFGPFNKKLVLTGLLAAVLSGPYMYQISSKDFNFEEFASTAPEATAIQKARIDYEVDRDLLLEKLKKANPTKYGSLKEELPPLAEITDEALKKEVAAIEAKRIVLEGKRAEAERERRIKVAEQKLKDEAEATEKAEKEKKEAAEKAEKERKEAAEKAEKKKKEDAAEAKRLDCNDKDKTASERRDCREDAKREEKEKKAEEASKKFDDKLETSWRYCESRSERTKDSSTRASDSAEDIELACKSKAFVKAMSTRDKNLSATAVNSQFRELLGNDLFAMLYSDDEKDAERASIILSNIFNGKVPSQYAGLKRMIMDEVRRRADAPAKKVAAEFKKVNQLPQNSTERTAQFTAAMAARSELETKLEVYSSSMLYPAQRASDQDALSYYKTSYAKGIESLLLRVMTGSSITAGGEVGGASRGGATRGGSNTEARVVTTADGKMVHTNGGVEYSLVSPGTTKHISFGTPSSTRGTETRGGVRVTN